MKSHPDAITVLDHNVGIAGTLMAALYNEKSRTMVLFFSNITSTEALRKFAKSSDIHCSIMDSSGKQKKGKQLILIEKEIKENKIILHFDLTIPMDGKKKSSTAIIKSDIAIGDTIAFSTIQSGCIRFVQITENFLN